MQTGVLPTSTDEALTHNAGVTHTLPSTETQSSLERMTLQPAAATVAEVVVDEATGACLWMRDSFACDGANKIHDCGNSAPHTTCGKRHTKHILYRLFYTVHVACKQAACTAQTVPCMQRPARCLWQSDTRLAQLHVLFPVLMAYLVLRRKCTRTCIRARMHASITANKV